MADRRKSCALIALAAAATLGALCGCSGGGPLKPGLRYPTGMPRAEPSNIQLVRSPRTVRMTNTTADSYGPSTVWLNQWYAAEIDELPIGGSVALRLSRFEDEFGDSFRGGGFFAAQSPDIIVKAELETELDGRPVLIPLIVVGDQN